MAILSQELGTSQLRETMRLFGHHFLVTQFPSLITHNSKYQGCLASSLTSHHLIFFTLFVGPISVIGVAFSFSFSFFFFLQYPNSSNLVKKKKNKRKKEQTEPMKKKRKEKKKPRTDRIGRKKKKKKK